MNLDFSHTCSNISVIVAFVLVPKKSPLSEFEPNCSSVAITSACDHGGKQRTAKDERRTANGEQRVRPRAREMKTINNNFIKYEYTSIHLERAPKTLRS